jgi:hypothetical protein
MTSRTLKPVKPVHGIPPLRDGERLSRDEFERRYDAMPEDTRAELMEGVVHMPSPVRVGPHAEPHLDLSVWFGTYRIYTPGVRGGIGATVRLDMKNERQPDGVLFVERHRGGQGLIDADGYISGSPELAAEISASTLQVDLDSKFNAYKRNRVQEYVIWRVLQKAVDWYRLRAGEYEPLPKSPAGYLQGEVLPGLWLEPLALVNGDAARVMEVLHEGLKSPEHAQFVARLQGS